MASRQQSDAASPRSLKGKVAIVTASTNGIGLAVARGLAQEGAKVTVSSRKEANVKRAVDTLRGEGLDVVGVTCHVSKADQRKNLIEGTLSHFGKIDILVSNAAVNPTFGRYLIDFEESAWDKARAVNKWIWTSARSWLGLHHRNLHIFDVNVRSSILLTNEVLPHMVKQPSGRIVFVSTIGAYVITSGNGRYTTRQRAFIDLTFLIWTRKLAKFGKDKITVNYLAPGYLKAYVASKRTQRENAREIKKGEACESTQSPRSNSKMVGSDYSQKPLPLSRGAGPGKIVSYLCSDDARHITGESFIRHDPEW